MLTATQIQDKIKNCEYKQDIDAAVRLQNINKLYTIPFMRENQYENSEWSHLLKRVKDRIENKLAFNQFIANINYPLSVTKFVNKKVFSALSKIWDGEGFFIDRKPKIKAEGQPDLNFYKNIYWRKYQTSPNDLLVLYKSDGVVNWHWLDICNVIHLSFNIVDGKYILNEIAFKSGKEEVKYIDSNQWGTYSTKGGRYTEIDSSIHGFGFCPVEFVSSDLFNDRPVIRQNNLADSLGDLEKLFMVSVQVALQDRHINPYMITIDSKGCEYDNGTNFCKDGYLYTKVENGEDQSVGDSTGKPLACPICNTDNLGFGSQIDIEVDTQDAAGVQSIIQNALNYEYLPAEALKYPTERQKYLKQEILNDIIGVREELNSSQQHNEARVLSTREEMLQVIYRTKIVPEVFMSNVDSMYFKMLNSSYIGTTVNLGDDFYLNSESEYQDKIKLGNETRTEDYINNKRGLIEVKYKANPDKRDREIIIHELEKVLRPYNNLSNEQVEKSTRITDKEFWLNQEFYRLISLIEIENNEQIHILLSNKNHNERIKFVNTKIESYYEQREKQEQVD